MLGDSARRAACGVIVLLASIVMCASVLQAQEAGTIPLAIRGYDPVAYFTERVPRAELPISKIRGTDNDIVS